MKHFILLLFIFQSIFCNAQINIDCKLKKDSSDIKVDSLFTHHINSLKSNIKDNMIVMKNASDNDILFLDFFYYLSGIHIGEREHSYGNLPLYVKPYEIKKIENWYYLRKDKITWDNVNKIYLLMKQMLSVSFNDFNELESSYNKIDNELKKLKID